MISTFHPFTDLGIGEKEFRTIEREVKLYWAGLESEESFCSRLEQLLSPVEELR
jgi:multiple sugar transport system substrate-binding protein